MATTPQQRTEKRDNNGRTQATPPQQQLERARPRGRLVTPRLLTPFAALNPFAMMRRLFDDLDSISGTGLERSQTQMYDPSGVLFTPRIDVVQRDGKLVVQADLPGMSADDVRVMIDDDAIVIDGERRMEQVYDEDDVRIAERAYGRFRRVIPLPVGAEPDSAEARFDSGVLEITVRLPDESKRGRQVEVKQSGKEPSREASRSLQ